MQEILPIKCQPLCHIAIMKSSWGLTAKILSGEKTVESRWYKQKTAPWDRIRPGDTIYFKDSGKPVSIRVKVWRVLQFADLSEEGRQKILKKYSRDDLGIKEISPVVANYIKNKKYCLLIFFKDVQKIKPFTINKKGFGSMSAWITIKDISQIKK